MNEIRLIIVFLNNVIEEFLTVSYKGDSFLRYRYLLGSARFVFPLEVHLATELVVNYFVPDSKDRIRLIFATD